MDSFIRWAGSKRSLLSELCRFIPTFKGRYVEPFAGSAALFFRLAPRAALLADLNEDLVLALKAVKVNPFGVMECFRRLPRGRRAYYAIRSEHSEGTSETERAAKFIYLNRYCFNGLYRTNSLGVFNVPYGPPRTPLVNFEDRVLSASPMLRRATIKIQDFRQTLDEVRRTDLVYIDPPYVTDERRIFREYLPGTFRSSDLDDLFGKLDAIHRKGAVFLLSYASVPEIRPLLRKWSYRMLHVRRNVAGFAAHRRSAPEYLISNGPLTTRLRK